MQPTVKTFKAPEFTPDADDKHYAPFGSELKGIDFGKKYEFKVDSNPRVGQYNTDNSVTKTKSISAQIREPTSSYRRPKENSPEPGQYDSGQNSFGKDTKSYEFGRKYAENYDPNLGPGTYDADNAKDAIGSKSRFAIIKED